MLATIVDLSALWKILLAAFAVGVGATAVFGQGAQAAQRIADARRRGSTADLVLNGAVVGLAGLVCAAVLVVGVIAMTHK
jgi:hypothetical protein